MKDAKVVVQIRAKILQNLGHDLFLIEDEYGRTLKCRQSGKIRLRKILLVAGDFVLVELSPYDLTHGRIVRRI